jgi:hypothetical protein
MVGNDDMKFLPKKYATRAEAATVCYRLIAATEKNTENIFAEAALHYDCDAGSGGVYRSLTLNSDGSFTGGYVGNTYETATGYPGGTVYVSNFSGKFSTPQRVSEHVYVMRLEELNLKGNVGDVDYEWGRRYITVEPEGFLKYGTFYLYLPGIATSELSYSFLNWDPIYGNTKIYPYLTYYGIYDVSAGTGYYAKS